MSKNTLSRRNSTMFFSLILLSFLMTQCTKPTSIGGDLVNTDQFDFFSTDTFSLKVKTVKADDSLWTFLYSTTSIARPEYYLGNLEDPVFGLNSSEIFAQYGPSPGDFGGKFKDATVDSVVLTLILDSAKFYGNVDVTQSIEIYRLQDPMRIDTSYYSFQDFAVESTPIGAINNFVPNLNKRLLVVALDSTVKDSNLVFLRIPLDPLIGQQMLDLDSIEYTTAEKFAAHFRGIAIKATTNTGAMMALDFNAKLSEIDVYYQKPSEDSLLFRLHSHRGYPTTSFNSKDYTASFVEPYIDTQHDDLFFLQSTNGLNVEVELPDLSSLGNVIVNKAVIELTLENLSIDDTLTFLTTPDFILTDTSGANIGGTLTQTGSNPVTATLKNIEKNGVLRRVIQFNISVLMQKIQRGDAGKIVVIKPRSSMRMGRAVLQGFSGEAISQPKLYLNFTEID